MMQRSLDDIRSHAIAALVRHGHVSVAPAAAENCAWLEAVGYPGLTLLAEALNDPRSHVDLERDALGLDLENVSCVFIGPAVAAEVAQNGRAFLRNVRHGLYLVPASVNGNFGIGCPVDPSFALGGERSKNPYSEKLDLAAQQGVGVDDAIWQSLA
jgi:hypothetical protein